MAREYGSYGARSNNLGFDTTPYDKKQEEIIQKYGKLAAERRAQVLAERKKLEGDEKRKERNWHAHAARGASLGSMVNPGWGTAIGGIIGGGIGLVKATRSRQREGQSGLQAFGNSISDFEGLTSGEAFGAAAPAAAALGRSYQQQRQARERPLGMTAMDEEQPQPESLEELEAGERFQLQEPGALNYRRRPRGY